MKRMFVVLSSLPLLSLALLVGAPFQTTPIDGKYAALNGSSSFLGSPTTAELGASVAGGRYRHYEHGSIYWSPETGAHEIHGMIRDRWADHGWERGYLGYPISDEMDTFDGAGRVSKFQFGDLIWRRATNAVSEVKSTDLALDLPFPVGLPWMVTQANAIGEEGSHRGPWAHCFDFTWAGAPMSGSNGRAFVAAASTEILYVEDGLGPGEAPGNVIIQRLGEGRYASYLHNQKGSYSANYGHGGMLPQGTPGAWPRPRSGTVLAQVGDTGTGVGAYHLHFCVTTKPDRAALFGRRFESVPVSFQNYSYSADGGASWHTIARRVPRRNEWLRREPAKTGQVSPVVQASSSVINYATVNGRVTLGPGTGRPSGPGKLKISVLSGWGETLQGVGLSVPAGSPGPWPYHIVNVPAYDNLRVTVRYEGPWSVSTGGPVAGQGAKFDLAPNATVTQDVQLTATLLK